MATLWEYLWSGAAVTMGYYKLNGNSTDSSGNANNWTDTSMTYADALFWQWGSFNNTAKYITIADAASLQTTSAITYIAWIKLSASTDELIFVKRVVWTLEYTVYIWWSADFRISQWGVSWVNFCRWDTTSFNLLANWWWHMLAFSHTFWASTSIAYVDWLPVTLTWTNQTAAAATPDWTRSLYIGKNWSAATSYVNWLMDSIIFEKRAWTAQQILKYYSFAKWRYATL